MSTRVIAYLENRTGEQMGKLIARLGVEPLHAPALAEEPDIDPVQLRQWIDQWETTQDAVVIFQTGVGVEALFKSMQALGLTQRFRERLSNSTVMVRGPKPTAALRKRQIRIDLSAASPFTTATLMQALAGTALKDRRVFVQRHGGDNPELMEALRAAGADVMEITAYRWGLPADTAPLDRLLRALVDGVVDTLVFTSASQIVNLLEQAQRNGLREPCLAGIAKAQVLSVGPVCTAALRQQGVRVTGEASPPKLGPLMALLEDSLRARGVLPA